VLCAQVQVEFQAVMEGAGGAGGMPNAGGALGPILQGLMFAMGQGGFPMPGPGAGAPAAAGGAAGAAGAAPGGGNAIAQQGRGRAGASARWSALSACQAWGTESWGWWRAMQDVGESVGMAT
jgi:hypothetical protein